jgi:hypothetical protein
VADVAADADPYTGVKVYDSVPEALGTPEEATNKNVPYWTLIGGTSVASPIIASAFALAGGAHGVAYPAATLYGHAGTNALHDVASGGNGECDSIYTSGCSGSLNSPVDCGALYTVCNAAPGYDGPTGIGTPDGLTVFQPPPTGSGNPGGGSGGTEGGPSGSGGGGSGGGPGSAQSGGSSGGAGGQSGSGGQAKPGASARTRSVCHAPNHLRQKRRGRSLPVKCRSPRRKLTRRRRGAPPARPAG